MFRRPLANQEGIGLIAAIFIIVVVGMFGVLIARYTMISSQTSAEDYLWSQSLYAAESGARLRILQDDGGGPAGWVWSPPTMNTFTLTVSTPTVVGGSTTIQEITSQASRATITRTIQVRYSLF
jgi:heme/copper-type cytochrome/quinol oxidase subunit 3